MKKTLIALLLILTLILVGCGNDKNSTNTTINAIENIETNIPDVDNGVVEETEEVVTETEEAAGGEEQAPEEETSDEAVIDPTGKIFSQLTGLELTEEESLKRPYVVMLDNHYKARPQAGLSDAEVVYEVLAEGLITRYMAVFQKNEPEVIGPVRSSRPYYIERALEFNPLYVHVGGSTQALTDIINYKMADVDGLSVGAGVFYRTSHKKMPHNAYSSHDGIRKEANRKNYFTEVEFAGMPISYEKYDLDGNQANEVTIWYKKPSGSDSTGYSVSFEYDEANENYLRYVNSSPHKDEETDIHLSADNIIVQKVFHKTIDSAGRRQVSMVGSGDGYYINKGTYIKITWKKTGIYDQTKYYYEDGSELILNPGVTWVQVITTSMEPSIE
ncbi:DUF3048 domain-containing protein [Acidaminobacter sp. JC074]|uniref:DUF3048 domain-containing protein n=1 Tax=Acidaminobacter sp. JC074 TaxID=2530199 RepID=UPI001F0E4864|nr:DUF3048 domain-containing protein [Acidaminobacter sp. JC074]MCH4887714.1 DUF3048 domain-containing protein [Acidaminobacter sp. JC074]